MRGRIGGVDDEVWWAAARAFPVLARLSDEAAATLRDAARVGVLEAGATIVRPHETCRALPLVLDGELRVHHTGVSGRDLTLYRILPGQTCVLTASCILAGGPFPAFVDVDEAGMAVFVPRATVEQLFAASDVWRRFVFDTLAARLSDMFGVVDSLVFTDLPARLATVVVAWQDRGVVRATHARLASEVGSSREVVSRVLKTWERQGLVSLERGEVGIVDIAALRRLAPM